MIFGALARPPRFLTETEVLSLHESAIQQHGGSTGVRDENLLGSAIAMAQQGFSGEFAHTVPFGMAAAYAFHICKNHPFVDGNKRTAFGACAAFLFLNGWELVSADNVTAEQIVAIAENRLDKTQFERWLMEHCRPRPSNELRDFFAGLRYEQLATKFSSLGAGSVPERIASILEASQAMPAVHEANLGAMAAEQAGDALSATILRQHSLLLTAMYRIAEDAGYEW